jgi:rhodanese-related sulfurtransferase
VIQRGHDRDATLPEIFQKTDRGCPPFCVQPMVAVPGVDTVGELEVLGYLARIAQGDESILVVDSRTPDWVMRGTIPGSVNIPWNKINTDTAGTFETPAEAEGLVHILADEFGADYDAASGAWDFSKAKTLVLFCNGIWCPQSTANLKTLVELGYPVHKLKWYRGGMQDWVSVGLTAVKP